MSEFKIIPQAPDYKINKEEEVLRVANDHPLFVLSGGKVLLKKPDGSLEHFFTKELVKQLFKEEGDEIKESPKKSVNIDPIEETPIIIVPDSIIEPTETVGIIGDNISSEATNTHESEDAALIKDDVAETNTQQVVEKKKRGRKPGQKNKVKDPNAPVIVKVKGKRGRKPGKKNGEPKAPKVKKGEIEVPSSYTVTPAIEKVLEFDCTDSIKIWKLSELGCAIPEILFHLKQKPTQAHSARGIICRYRNNKKLKDKASLIK